MSSRVAAFIANGPAERKPNSMIVGPSLVGSEYKEPGGAVPPGSTEVRDDLNLDRVASVVGCFVTFGAGE